MKRLKHLALKLNQPRTWNPYVFLVLSPIFAYILLSSLVSPGLLATLTPVPTHCRSQIAAVGTPLVAGARNQLQSSVRECSFSPSLLLPGGTLAFRWHWKPGSRWSGLPLPLARGVMGKRWAKRVPNLWPSPLCLEASEVLRLKIRNVDLFWRVCVCVDVSYSWYGALPLLEIHRGVGETVGVT